MIELILRSGLGNQMFQYAYARKMQEKIGEPIAINTLYMDKHDFRKYSLNHFRLNETVSVLDKKQSEHDLINFYLRLPVGFGKDFWSWRLFHRQALGEDKYLKRSNKGLYYAHLPEESYSIVESKSRKKYVFGFFQNYATVEGIEDILREEFIIKTEPSDANKEMLKKIQKENSVCLHIRRGDYLDEKWKCMQVCNENYYYTAVNSVLNSVENPVFFVFSTGHDDIRWIKENYHFNAKVEYVDLDNPDYEELRLMMNCKNFIISNSTFSWWAAFLAKNQKKKVWVPDTWRKGSPEANVIIPATWIKIKV